MSVKRVVIIGATSGIGLEVAKGYLKAGWQVGIAGRREEELKSPPDCSRTGVCPSLGRHSRRCTLFAETTDRRVGRYGFIFAELRHW